jgi:hypothetical protein
MTSESDSGERVAVYVCYFGLCQPLVQTQVISYLRELRAAGYRLILVTFEPKDDPSREQEKIAARRRVTPRVRLSRLAGNLVPDR